MPSTSTTSAPDDESAGGTNERRLRVCPLTVLPFVVVARLRCIGGGRPGGGDQTSCTQAAVSPQATCSSSVTSRSASRRAQASPWCWASTYTSSPNRDHIALRRRLDVITPRVTISLPRNTR